MYLENQIYLKKVGGNSVHNLGAVIFYSDMYVLYTDVYTVCII